MSLILSVVILHALVHAINGVWSHWEFASQGKIQLEELCELPPRWMLPLQPLQMSTTVSQQCILAKFPFWIFVH